MAKRFFLKQKTFQKNNQSGFTLIEIVVVMAIIGMFLALGASSTRLSRGEFILTTSQEQLRALISRAKFLTVNSLFSPEDNICAYGVEINAAEKKAIIFEARPKINCPTFNTIDTIYQNTDRHYLTGSFNVTHLEKGVRLNNSFHVYFLPPDPLVALYKNGDFQKDDIMIELFIPNVDSRRGILINKEGLIDLIQP